VEPPRVARRPLAEKRLAAVLRKRYRISRPQLGCSRNAHTFSLQLAAALRKRYRISHPLSKLCRKTHTHFHSLPLNTQLEING
jgi:hypothetical protein